MDKESIYELQKIDCNCNDCGHMIRDFDRFKKSLADHRKWQLDLFETTKRKLKEKAEHWKGLGEIEKADSLFKEVDKMNFFFDKSECKINFGKCALLKKEITFIPNVLQLETQGCFVHRKDSIAG